MNTVLKKNTYMKYGLFSLLFMAGTASAGVSNYFSFNPYIGVGASYLRINATGSEQARKRLPGGDEFFRFGPFKEYMHKDFMTFEGIIGFDFSKYLGVELSHQHSNTLRKSKTAGMERFTFFNNGGGTDLTTKVSFHLYNVDFHGFYPVNDCWRLGASVGMAYFMPRVDMQMRDDDTTRREIIQVDQRKSDHRFIFRAGINAVYRFSDIVSIRGAGYFLKTSKFKIQMCDDRMPDRCYNDVKIFRDSCLFSLAVIAKIC